VSDPRAPLVVVMGVAGAGKSTVGPLVAERLHVPFVDADDLHDPGDREQMRRGEPLTDAQRAPWLDRVHTVLADHATRGVVVACSALTPAHRATIHGDLAGVAFVDLVVAPDVLRHRLGQRAGHFAGADLLDSQLRTLAVDDQVLPVDGEQPPDEVAAAIVAAVLTD
jgi:gluconokinase